MREDGGRRGSYPIEQLVHLSAQHLTGFVKGSNCPLNSQVEQEGEVFVKEYNIILEAEVLLCFLLYFIFLCR